MWNPLARKPLDTLMQEAGESGPHTLRRALGPWNLVTLGIGAIIGTGIFVLSGVAAAQYAGPAIVLSFIVAGAACIFAGLCYAEFASMIPVAGSAYTYGYATLGEIFAWVIGWDLVLEYAFGAATVASGWSGYFVSLLQDLGINLPPKIAGAPGTPFLWYQGHWESFGRLEKAFTAAHIDPATFPHQTAALNLVAFAVILGVTAILVVGIKESANFNTAIVLIKVAVLLVFIGLGARFLALHHDVARANWTPFLPPNQGSFGAFGWSGVLRAAGVIFFAYIGFDAVSTAAQEARNPQKDMPIGIMGSLAVCTVLYIAVAIVLNGLVKYDQLAVPDPLAVGIDRTGVRWGSIMVKLGALCGLSSTMIVMLLGQSRVFFSMSRDGLLPRWAAAIHPRFRTPWISSLVVGTFVALFAALIPISVLGELVSIGTLLAFIIVCAGVLVLRRRRPDLHRPFRTPFVPAVPILGILISLLMMLALPLDTWIRLVIWLVVGMAIYFGYGRRHSRVQQATPTAADAALPRAAGRR